MFFSAIKKIFKLKSKLEIDHMEDYQRVDYQQDDINQQYQEFCNFPPQFDQEHFLDEMRERYFIFNKAWNDNNIRSLEVYLSKELFEKGYEERERAPDEQDIQIFDVEVKITYSDYDEDMAKITLHFTGNFHDTVSGSKGQINEKWYLERSQMISDSLWFIVGLKTNM